MAYNRLEKCPKEQFHVTINKPIDFEMNVEENDAQPLQTVSDQEENREGVTLQDLMKLIIENNKPIE